MRIWLAIRAFCAVLFHGAAAERVRRAIEPEVSPVIDSRPTGSVESTPAPSMAPRPSPSPGPVVRNDAITLLAALQREARFVDIVQEPVGEYSDEQVGAAARDVLRNCAAAIERIFALRPALVQEEESDVEVPHGYDPLRYRLVGRVAGEPPFRGKLMHHGWIATRCELPAWSGNSQAANVIAPVEVEVE